MIESSQRDSALVKVVLLVSGLMYGGGQKVALGLLRELRLTNGLDVRLILLGCREPTLEQAASHVMPYDGRYNRLTTLLATAWRLRNHLKTDRPDVLHTHGWDADLIGWLSIVGRRTRQVIHLHVTPQWLESRRPIHRARRFLTRRAFARRCTTLIAVSNAVREHWAKLLPWSESLIATVHNGVDSDFCPVPEIRGDNPGDGPVLGAVSRLAPMKGLEHLLDALPGLRAEYPQIRLRIAGDGGLKEDLHRRASALGLDGSVEFLGHVQDMKTFYGSIDLLVLPSIHTEGLPLVVLEAMAAGLPVVATTVGGTPEVVRDGREGLLVPPGNSAALADAIGRLLADAPLRRRLGECARRRVVQDFSMAKCANAVLGLYRGSAAERAR